MHSPTKKTMNGYVLMNKEEKFILFASNKIKHHLELYIDADVRALDGTWCFFCHNKLNKKNGKNSQNWDWVKGDKDFEKIKLIAIEIYDYEFAVHEAIPRLLWVCDQCKKNSGKYFRGYDYIPEKE